MGFIQMGIPTDLVLRLIAARPTPNLVETGTFKGDTARWAANHFRKVITIELNPELSRLAAAAANGAKNIEFVIGNSAAVLSEIVKRLEGPALFWLDGHYCGPGTGDETEECPILEELAALEGLPEPIILVDDARCFFGPPPAPHNAAGWPNIDKIFKVLGTKFPGHVTTIHDDVIISVPARLKPILDADWAANFEQRFPSHPDLEQGLVRRLKRLAFRPF